MSKNGFVTPRVSVTPRVAVSLGLLFCCLGGSLFCSDFFYTKVDAGGPLHWYRCFYGQKNEWGSYGNEEEIWLCGKKENNDGFVSIGKGRGGKELYKVYVYGSGHDLRILGRNFCPDWNVNDNKYLIIQLDWNNICCMASLKRSLLCLKELRCYTLPSATFEIMLCEDKDDVVMTKDRTDDILRKFVKGIISYEKSCGSDEEMEDEGGMESSSFRKWYGGT